MSLFLVALERRQPSEDAPLQRALGDLGATRLLEHFWLVDGEMSVAAIRERLKRAIAPEDGVAVIEIKPNSAWSIHRSFQAGVDWLEANVRGYRPDAKVS